MKNILVTGSSGFVGCAVADALTRDGSFHVVRPGHKDDLGFSGVPDMVFHLAASVPGRNGRVDDDAAADETRRIDRNVLDVCREWQCPAVYASGCSLYGVRHDDTPFYEDDALEAAPASPYLSAKRAGDLAFQELECAAIFRISAPVGPGLSPQSVMGRFLAVHDITLWGDGTREQDFIDVRDIAAAFIAFAKNPSGGIFNIARGVPVTMKDLAGEIVKIRGGSISFADRADPAEGVKARFDISRAKKIFNWSPRFSLTDSIHHCLGAV